MRSRIIFAIAVSAALFVWFAAFQRYYPHARTFQSDSEELVLIAMRERAAGMNRYGGFLGEAYLSQYGLQGKIFAAIRPPAPIARLATAALFAMTLALFVTTVRYEFGNIAAWTVFGGILASPWLALFAPNLYWVIFTHFMPFVAAWTVYPKLKRRFGVFLLLIGGLVLFKALSGYEYLTNIVLSPIVPLIYYESKDGTSRRMLFKKAVFVFLAGIAGFAGAFALHLWQGAVYLGSWTEASSYISLRALGRTTGGDIRTTLGTYLELLPRYLVGYPSATPTGFVGVLERVGGRSLAFIPLVAGLLCAAYVTLTERGRRMVETNRAMYALFSATAFSYLTTFSWAAAAPQHMMHTTINNVIFYLPANLMAFVLVAVVIRARVVDRLAG